MKKLLVGLLAGCVAGMAATASVAAETTSPVSASPASASPVSPGAPERYTVTQGDTLWDIASRFLKDPWAWPEIWQVNQQIDNPHLIYPGDTILLCDNHGQPLLAKDHGGGCAQAVANANNASADNATTASSPSSSALPPTPLRVVKLRPRAEEQPLGTAIPAVPLPAVRAFLDQSRIVGRNQLAYAPYVMAGQDNRVIWGTGDQVYARGDWARSNETTYGVYRGGQVYQDPATGEVLGHEARFIAMATVESVNKDMATIRLSGSKQDVRVEDRLIPIDERRVTPVFHPRNPQTIKGRILRSMDSVDKAAKNSVVVINKGERDGVEVGHVFTVFGNARSVTDRVTKELVRLPGERSGMVMVFRTFDKVSYALVVKSLNPINVGDELRPPSSGD